MLSWPADCHFNQTHPGYYDPVERKRLLRSYDGLHVTEQLHKTSIHGHFYPTGLRLHVQRSKLPNSPCWSIMSRHDMFCGIFNAAGDRFYSGSHDGVVRVFDSSRHYFALLGEIECPSHFWSVVSMSLSPNERHLVYSVLSEKIQLITFRENEHNPQSTTINCDHPNGDGNTGEFNGVVKTFSVCFDGSGSRILAGHNSGIVHIYDVGDGRCVRYTSYCHEGYRDVNALTAVDAAGNVFLAGGDDTNIRLFDLRAINKGTLAVFTGHADGITYLDSKGDRTYFLSNSKDQRVKLWDMRKHTKPGRERQRQSRFSWDYRYHPVPRAYFNSYNDGCRRGDQSVLTLCGHSVRFSLIRVRFSPAHSTGQRFAYAGSANGAWPIWDLFTGKSIQFNSSGSQSIRDVHWHPWDPIAISSDMDGALTCWTHGDAQSDNQGRDRPASSEELRAHLLSLDPTGEHYELPLARSGLRYQFPGEGRFESSSHSSNSTYYDMVRYVTENADDDEADTAFLTMSDSSDSQSEIGLRLSDFSDEEDSEFDPRPYVVADLEFELEQVSRRPITRSQTRGGRRLRQRDRRASLRQTSHQNTSRSDAQSSSTSSGTRITRHAAGTSASARSRNPPEPEQKRRRGR